ncbi:MULTISPECIES: MarR family transcriptional regulator [Paenarthrobacter]|jgi:DNA-binding MarR family transcriptional regulator|uniref:MarR family winged helix-turn-helix transcriptional regulator n=1 Tax=Paenarthrobacter TaxID=1742992 RepID=UPI00166C83F9|nr:MULTISPECIES: MarR family transcriptional regulator [Paenarthrobacter]MBP2394245.1 DNA-binding MarR family transcriptional regulator [Paenarthrobacter nicotinovorans]UKE99548.1 MarR family transcriptional regulator [Paenarthrobacter nicotinovorans]UKF04332.1 MarR family transcriptional regulator [Paenarthrobacter nicotinovorans]GGV39099.1 MarR family transcriptional regulator [Paenarthrobacter nicotinovorans]
MSSLEELPEEAGFPVSSGLYHLDANDPHQQLIDRSRFSEADIVQISELMAALGRLRDAEQRLAEASLRYMKLNQSDMRALHYLIVCANHGVIATPGAIASHLNISTASTTKLLDRLERAGHVTRQAHPSDRRALAIAITPETHEAAMRTVGKQQAKRFLAAARLTPDERVAVMRFLDDMAREIEVADEPWAAAPR